MTDLREILAAATPGPWEADGPPWNRIVWSSAENRVCFMAHSNGLDDVRDIATSNLIALAPDLAAEVLALRDQVETAYVRGFHDAQEKAKVEGKLVLIDSPELVALREENAKLREALTTAMDGLSHIAALDDEGGNRYLQETGCFTAFDEPHSCIRARAALSDIKNITGGGNG